MVIGLGWKPVDGKGRTENGNGAGGPPSGVSGWTMVGVGLGLGMGLAWGGEHGVTLGSLPSVNPAEVGGWVSLCH